MNIQINEDLKQAMKEKDAFKLSVLRMLKSALQLEQIAKKRSCLSKGREIDYLKASTIILNDIKNNNFKDITLDRLN